ncbi:MAG TPA: hypothetical protein VK833_00830, partial [Gillisia sp.]|nr:hypothetical protein [Gillisia sp.]
MANNYMNILWAKTSRGTHLGGNRIMFFGFLFFMLFSSLNVVGQAPNYTYDPASSKDLDFFT